MPPLRVRLALTAALGAGALAVPAAQAQAQVALAVPLEPCYVSVDFAHREPIYIRATGFSPNAVVELSIGDQSTRLDANANGVVRTKRPGPAAPYVERGEQAVPVSLAEQKPNIANVYQTTTKVTALSVTARPRKAATSRRVRFRGRGFTRQKAIWGHYLYRDRLQKTVQFAERPSGDCGTFSVRRRQIPIRHPHPGKWTLQVDQQKHWSPTPKSVFFPLKITVERMIGR